VREWSVKYYFEYKCGVSKYYFEYESGVSKYYFEYKRGVSKYYFEYKCGVSTYYFEYKYAKQSGVECIGVAREARPPYGVSGKEDHSNTRELIRSENMDRQGALVPSH
jgi:hypothetical protein